MKKTKLARTASIVLGAGVLATGGTAAFGQYMSQDFMKPYDESATIYLGGILNQFDTSVRLDGNGTRGSDINLESNGLKKNLSSFEGGLTWRFLPAHRFDANYYTVSRSGTHTYTNEIDIGGDHFPVGADVFARSKYDLFAIDYRYSLVQQPDFEWAVGLGIYGGKITFDVNATGLNTSAGLTYNNSVSTTLPLPLIGTSLEWYPDRQWKVGLNLQGMKAKISDVDGHAYILGGNVDYMFARNWGVGLRYEYVDIGADVTKSSFNGGLTWRANALSAYVKLAF